MTKTVAENKSSLVRRYVRETYLKAALRRGEARFTVNAGEIHKALGFKSRIPLVCAALTSKKFLAESGLRLIEKNGPPSGLSNTVTLKYEIVKADTSFVSDADLWLRIRGIAKEVFHKLGGGEAFIANERRSFASALGDHSRRESER